MASIATAGTRAELVTLYESVHKLDIALRQIVDGSGSPANPGRYLATDIDTLISAVSTAITAGTT